MVISTSFYSSAFSVLLLCSFCAVLQGQTIRTIAGDFGRRITCEPSEVMVGACSSGRSRDCFNQRDNEDVSHLIRCRSIEQFPNGYPGLGDLIVPGDPWRDSGDFGRHVMCDRSGTFGSGLCAGGGDRDCRNPANNDNVVTQMRCSDASTVTLGSSNRQVCGRFGERIDCDNNWVVTNICTSGRDADCGGCGGRHYTVLTCRQLLITAQTRAPTLSPTLRRTSAPVLPTVPPEVQSCLDDTRNVLLATDAEYNDEAVAALPIVVDNREAEFVDFSVNAGQNAIYRNACKEAGGAYQEITYMLECSSSGNADLDVFIIAHPRCYATICGKADQQALLNMFSVRLTEQRNNDGRDGNWQCSGVLTDDIPTGCEFETEGVNRLDNILVSKIALLPTVEQQKAFIIFPLNENLVTFSAVPNFRTTCLDGGFTFQNIGTATVECMSTEGLEEVRIFDVQDFPMCFGSSCDIANTPNTNAAILAQFVSVMVDSDELDETMSCMINEDWTLESVAVGGGRLGVGVWIGITIAVVLVAIGLIAIVNRMGNDKKLQQRK